MKKLRVLLLTLCVAVFMCGFTVTAHAGGGDEYIEPTDQWEGLEEPTPTRVEILGGIFMALWSA